MLNQLTYSYIDIFETLLLNEYINFVEFDNIKIEIFNETRNYTLTKVDQMPQVMKNIGENNFNIDGDIQIGDVIKCIADPLDKKKYILLCANFSVDPLIKVPHFEDEVSKAMSYLAIYTSSYSLFAKRVGNGFCIDPNEFVFPPLKINAALQVNINSQFQSIAKIYTDNIKKESDIENRFKLMSRFFSKALIESNDEERFLWLWTILEIFPMKNQTDIKPISEFLSKILKKDSVLIKDKLSIGKIFGIRSDFVHNGEFKVSETELSQYIEKLYLICITVLKSICGDSYSGELDKYFI